jgi:hypothetical protein
MRKEKIKNMVKGWFVGDFEPTLIKTRDVEVAVKEYRKGDKEGRHYHKVATEITVICSGRVLMNGIEHGKGDIIVIEPLESTNFEALEDTITTVVKHPGASNDKYEGSLND